MCVEYDSFSVTRKKCEEEEASGKSEANMAKGRQTRDIAIFRKIHARHATPRTHAPNQFDFPELPLSTHIAHE